jgi:hypothetical protein
MVLLHRLRPERLAIAIELPVAEIAASFDIRPVGPPQYHILED